MSTRVQCAAERQAEEGSAFGDKGRGRCPVTRTDRRDDRLVRAIDSDKAELNGPSPIEPPSWRPMRIFPRQCPNIPSSQGAPVGAPVPGGKWGCGRPVTPSLYG